MSSSSSTTWTMASSNISLVTPRSRKADHEKRAKVGIGPRIDGAAVQQDDATADRETETHSALLGGVEGIEKTRGAAGGKAHARVADFDDDRDAIRRRPDAEDSRPISHFAHAVDRVLYQVQHDLQQLGRIHAHYGLGRIEHDLGAN